MKTLFLIMILGFYSSPSELQTNIDPVVEAYLLVKEALVQSDSQTAFANSQKLLSTVEENSLSGTDLINAAKKLAAAKDLEKQRAAFAGFSTILWGLVNQSDYSQGTLYYQYCPMKKAYWLSAEAGIKNPYYGSSMLKCGSIADQMDN